MRMGWSGVLNSFHEEIFAADFRIGSKKLKGSFSAWYLIEGVLFEEERCGVGCVRRGC